MQDTQEENYLLRSFDGWPSRRAFLEMLIGGGAGLSISAGFANKLAAASADDVSALTIHAWPGLFADVLKATVNPAFERKFDKTKVALDVATQDSIYAKILASRARPVISGGMMADTNVYRGIADKVLVGIDGGNMPNMAKIPPNLILPGALGVGFVQSPFGIMYNPDRVEKPTSWSDLWNPKYKGRVALRELYFAQYIGAALAAGRPLNVEEGIKAWEPYKANIGEWVTSSAKAEEDVSRGEVWLSPNWGGWVELARTKGKNVAFSLPQEGGISYTGYIVSFGGFTPTATALTQNYLDIMISEEMQDLWMRSGFLIPTNRSVKVPADMLGVDAVMTAEDAGKRLVPYDVKAVGESVPKLLQLVNNTLK